MSEVEGQVYITLPVVNQDLFGGNTLEMVEMPLFRQLSAEEEVEFRAYTRANHKPGDPVNEIHHPVCQDEERKMNEEAAGVQSNPTTE